MKSFGPYDLRDGEEQMVDRLCAEHDNDEHLFPHDLCPRCDEEAKRIYCMFCGCLFTPVPGRVPSEACLQDWLEIQAGMKKAG